MKLLSHIFDLNAVSGGIAYSYDEFVTEDIIFFRSALSALQCGFTLGFFGGALGFIGSDGSMSVGAVCGGLSAAAGAYLGYHFNDYSDIEPNTWVHWTVVYY